LFDKPSIVIPKWMTWAKERGKSPVRFEKQLKQAGNFDRARRAPLDVSIDHPIDSDTSKQQMRLNDLKFTAARL
jgi:hypothetical protein